MYNITSCKIYRAESEDGFRISKILDNASAETVFNDLIMVGLGISGFSQIPCTNVGPFVMFFSQKTQGRYLFAQVEYE